MKKINKKTKREHSRGVVFTTAKSDSDRYFITGSSSVAVVKTTTGSCFLCFAFLFKFFLYTLPFILFFSYHPIISLGSSETMNFELSLPLIWLVLFDLLVLGAMIAKRMLFRELKGKWWIWVMLPVWLTISLIWSLNVVRGVLTVGILWLIVLAGYGMWSFRELFDVKFRKAWWGCLMGATLLVCIWCIIQCILDLDGVGRDHTLMCAGCTYKMFGFPHPNGFAIEPQFMGNLFLAPLLLTGWRMLRLGPRRHHLSPQGWRANSRAAALRVAPSPKHSADPFLESEGAEKQKILVDIICFFVIVGSLFLTFSRGAIYAFGVGLLFMTVAALVAGWQGRDNCKMKRMKRDAKMVKQEGERRGTVKRVGLVWGTVILAFGVTLVVQGLMAEASPTNDTFGTGVAKVLNHLSLGVIDLRQGEKTAAEEAQTKTAIEMGAMEKKDELLVVEKPVENFEEDRDSNDDTDEEEAIFDGYVAESTDTRVRLNNAALKIWSSDARTMLIGVGFGAAGQALYNNGLSPAPKEIVQNQYMSLLLETGIVGVLLALVTLVVAIRFALKLPNGVMILSLMLAYGISLMFFAGLPNALQIYLLPLLLCVMSASPKLRRVSR